MLKRLHLRNFTVFEDAEFDFGPGLNVVVGTNGTGKSHVLKVGYAGLRSITSRLREWRGVSLDSPLSSLIRIFRPEPADIKQLLRRGEGIANGEVIYWLDDERLSAVQLILSPDFSTESSLKAKSDAAAAEISILNTTPVFIPAKETLTLGWLLSLYDRREIPIDETYPDLLRLLMGPPLRQPEPAHIVAKLQQLIGGKVEEEGGRFYLADQEKPRMEMNLVAEGMRKFATLYKLLANGTLTPETTLFWDEPEANLNPALLKEMAAVLAELARAGFQIILATHSLFLLKELHILSQQVPLPIKYFGLSAQPGEASTVTAADNLELLPDIVALDAELEQSDRFQRVLDQEDGNHN
jgi:predicted ATPase